MGKRTVAIGVMGLGLALMQMGETQAHGLPVGGSWYPCCSITSDSEFKGISNPEQKPGKTVWVASNLEYQFLCYNPADNRASAQVMLRGGTTSTSEDFEDGNWTKQQGRLKQNATLDTGSLATQAGCETLGGGHHNWIPKPDTVVVTKFDGTISALGCLNEDCTQTELLGKILQTCELPGPWSAFNPPVQSNDCPGVGCQYECDTVLFHNK